MFLEQIWSLLCELHMWLVNMGENWGFQSIESVILQLLSHKPVHEFNHEIHPLKDDGQNSLNI